MKFKLLNILVILALVASLCAVTGVTPALAAAVISFDTFSMTNPDAGKMSGYTVEFTAFTALAQGQNIIITFPFGCDLTGASLAGSAATSPYRVSVGGGALYGIANPSFAGQVLSLPCPEAVNAGESISVTIEQAANIINPDLSQELTDLTIPPPVRDYAWDSQYVWSVSTEADTILSGTAAQIYDYVQCDDYTLIPQQEVTVTGGGLGPGFSVTINGPVSGVGTINSDGAFIVTGVATGQPGTLTASDGTGRFAWISASSFVILPTMTVTPSSGLPGDTVTIRGFNFNELWNPGSIMIMGNTLLVNAGSLTAIDLDMDTQLDDFIAQAAIPPTLNGGWYQLSCMDNAAGWPSVAIDTYEVSTRQITIDPPAGAPGSTVVVSGIGFPRNITEGTAILTYGNSGASGTITDLGVISTDDTGAFTVTGIIPYNATAGAHGVIVYFNADQPIAIPYSPLALDLVQAQGMFTVTSRALTIIPYEGPLGTRITVSDGGMYIPGIASPTATITVQGGLWNTHGTNGVVYLNSSGDIIPSTAKASDAYFNVGNNTIVATHNTSSAMTASAVFEITRPTLALDLSAGYPGTGVVATGSGWLHGQINFVTIRMNNGGSLQTVAIASPDSEGNIWISFTIPDDVTPGTNLAFTASDSNGNQSLIVPFSVNPLSNVIFVDFSAGGLNNGGSWDDAYTDLQDALFEASSGNEIWVASGTYTPGSSRMDSFAMKNGVTIYGGFDGSSYNPASRDWKGNSTVLSGDIGVIGNVSDNSYHVIFNSGSSVLNNTAIIDGLIVSGGNADGAVSSAGYGGGVLNVNSSPFIVNCVFVGNEAPFGGGMSNFSNSLPSIDSCSFLNNSATDGGGGGMYNASNSNPSVTNCTFSGNTTTWEGGGMYNYDESSPEVINCTFYGNTAAVQGSGLSNKYSYSMKIVNCIFWGNTNDEICDTNPEDSLVEYCNIQGGYPGTGNIDVEPYFEAPANGDFHLQWASTCIDKGNNAAQGLPATDFEGHPRIVGAVVDIGVDEVYVSHELAELNSIEGLYSKVWHYDAPTQEWYVHDRGQSIPPWFSAFDSLTAGQGYWIRVTQDCLLVTGAYTYNLYLGWNLIGWLG